MKLSIFISVMCLICRYTSLKCHKPVSSRKYRASGVLSSMLRYGAGRNLFKGNVRFDMGHAKWQSIWWAENSEPLMRKTVTWFDSWPSQFVKLMRILSTIKLGPTKTHKLFVSGSFKHARRRGHVVATTARVKLTRIPWYRDACKMTGCAGWASSNGRAVLPAKPIRFGTR